MKLIFLDIDSVLNHEEGHRKGECKFDSKNKYQKFANDSKNYLNLLTEITGAKLVISSSWRCDGIERLKQVFEWEGITGEIIGLTPHFSIREYGSAPRGCEIEHYLRQIVFYHIDWSKEEQQEYMDA